jgi:hypothetical protein
MYRVRLRIIDPSWGEALPAVYPKPPNVPRPHPFVVEPNFDASNLERTETPRSKSPQQGLQQLWGLAITYDLVRLETLQVANRLKLPRHGSTSDTHGPCRDGLSYWPWA